MTLRNGKGTRHDALEWNLRDDDANAALDGVSGGTLSWGLLFWVPLMANAEQDSVIRRWKTLVDALPTTEIRENVIGIVRWCSRNWHNATGSGNAD